MINTRKWKTFNLFSPHHLSSSSPPAAIRWQEYANNESRPSQALSACRPSSGYTGPMSPQASPHCLAHQPLYKPSTSTTRIKISSAFVLVIDFICKGSTNRAKNQIYLSFSEVQPTVGEAKGNNNPENDQIFMLKMNRSTRLCRFH